LIYSEVDGIFETFFITDFWIEGDEFIQQTVTIKIILN